MNAKPSHRFTIGFVLFWGLIAIILPSEGFAQSLPKVISIGCPSVGTAMHGQALAIAQFISERTPMQARIEPGEFLVGVDLLRKGEMEFNVNPMATVTMAIMGWAPFDKPQWGPQSIRTVWMGSPVASMTPLAQYNKPLTYEQIMASPTVVDPITVLQCCPQSDGGAALVLCSEEYFKKHNVNNHPKIKISASVLHSSGWLAIEKDPLSSRVMRETADMAYNMAGIEPKNLDLAEIHDAFSGEEIAAYDPLRFCPEGECINYTRAKYFDLKGKLPVNPSGGLLSLGHPLGASGTRVNCELVRQFRNQAGGYQVEGARIGLAQMLGSVLLGGPESPVVCGIQIPEKVW